MSTRKMGKVVGAVHGRVSTKKDRNQLPYEKSDIHFRITVDNTSLKPDSEVMETSNTMSVSNNRPSIFSRLGSNQQTTPKLTGTYVIFENLVAGVDHDDIKDLCESVGEIKSLDLTKAPGSMMKMAEVLFAQRSKAMECIKKYHSVKLDGYEMTVKLKGDDGKENPFNPVEVTSKPGGNNVRVGLFGTAIDHNDDNFDSNDNGDHHLHSAFSSSSSSFEQNTDTFKHRNVILEPAVKFSNDFHRQPTKFSNHDKDKRNFEKTTGMNKFNGKSNSSKSWKNKNRSHDVTITVDLDADLDSELDKYMNK